MILCEDLRKVRRLERRSLGNPKCLFAVVVLSFVCRENTTKLVRYVPEYSGQQSLQTIENDYLTMPLFAAYLRKLCGFHGVYFKKSLGQSKVECFIKFEDNV